MKKFHLETAVEDLQHVPSIIFRSLVSLPFCGIEQGTPRSGLPVGAPTRGALFVQEEMGGCWNQSGHKERPL